MATTYSLGFSPKWYEVNLVGLPLAGGYIASFSSLNHSQFKAIYQDPAGLFPYPYVTIPNVGSLGILFDENGTQGPFYFKFDSTTPDDLYYLEVYDSDGVLQWTIDDFTGNGSGGGGTVTTALDLQNLIPNNVMYRNRGVTPFTPTIFEVLSPGANSGLSLTSSLSGPDICFIKNNSSATDTISFPLFSAGSTVLTGDVTPVDYLHYVCTGAGTGETYKYVQFPITQGFQNLTNQDVTVTIWARCTSGNTNISMYWLQFYGDGPSASTSTREFIQTVTLTSSWQKFSVQDTVPDATGKISGECGNGGLFVQIQYALDAATTIDFTKPCVFLGAITPDQEYQTNDMIDAVVDGERTGDIKETCSSTIPNGWVPLNNGTIGSSTSGAVTRASIDTFPLFNILWNLPSTVIPMYTSAGTTQARGATASADFSANYQIQLIKSLGQTFAGSVQSNIAAYTFTADHTTSTLTLAGPPYASTFGTGSQITVSNSGGALPAGLVSGQVYFSIYLTATTMKLALNISDAIAGTFVTFSDNGSGTNSIQFNNQVFGIIEGERNHLQTISEMPAHDHPGSTVNRIQSGGGSSPALSADATTVTAVSPPLTIAPQGGGNAFNVVQPTTYIGRIIKL